jgi:hypothetical protein
MVGTTKKLNGGQSITQRSPAIYNGIELILFS